MAAKTYSPCPECRKLNRIEVQGSTPADMEPVCGSCKKPLPIHNGVNELNASELMTLVEKSPIPVVADFWAPWCQPCKVFAPIFQNVAQTMAHEVVFAKVNIDANPLASGTYGIRAVPTLILFRGGFERARQPTVLPQPDFVQWLRTAGVSQAA